tara:strand:- start:54 stop:611 length:558 start_codon:yes stop_codon:yes gene_type:complete
LVCGVGDRGVKPLKPPHLFLFLLCYVVSMKIKKTFFITTAIFLFLISSCQTMRGDKPLADRVIRSDPSVNLTLGLVQMTVKEGATKDDIISSLGSPNMVTSSGSKNETWIYDRVSTDIQRESESGSAGLEVGIRGSGNPVSGGLGVGASSNSSGEVVVRTQRTLTVIIKFIDGIVSSFQTRSTSF